MNHDIDALLNRARRVRQDLAFPGIAKAKSRRDRRASHRSDPGIVATVATVAASLGRRASIQLEEGGFTVVGNDA